MNPKDQSFVRKIVYLVAIALLLTAIIFLGRPATKDTDQVKGSPGGILARQRKAEGLTQTDLGEIDPTSETIKLATLGMRSVATIVLWHKATEYKKKKDWTNLKAAVEQIIRVQPNFISIWKFYGWTLAFNVSVEFDDFRERYRWIIQGINFLKKGTRYNEHSPPLDWETGWTINQKIGRSDERKQFRPLFYKDDDFHRDRVGPERDNWLVGREWYISAEEKVDAGDKMTQTPVVFRSCSPMCLMSYAKAKEDEGIFDEVACANWENAHRAWLRFGEKDVLASQGMEIRLNDQEKFEEDAKKVAEKLDAIKPGLREKIRQERYDSLTDEQREAYETDAADRTGDQHMLAEEAKDALKVSHKDVEKRIKGPMRSEARELANQATELEWTAGVIRRYRSIVNFNYWRDRAKIEQEPDTLFARKSIYKGDKALAAPNPTKALRLYDEGLAAWRRILDKYDGGKTDDGKDRINLLDDTTFVSDLIDVIDRYKVILGQLNEPFPEKGFILQDVLDKHKMQ